MNFGSAFGILLKGKIMIAIASLVVIGGGTVAMAATPMGQHIVHTIAATPRATSETDHSQHSSNNTNQNTTKTDVDHDGNNNHNNDTDNHNNAACPGLADAQRLAGLFGLSTASTSDDVRAICALHNGTFKGTTTSGAQISSNTALGYGEIDQLLTYAKFLASHDQANTGGKLTSNNARTYLATALKSCGTTPIMVCVKNHIPGLQSGNDSNQDEGNNLNHGKDNNSGNGDNGKKPTQTPASTPTPTVHHW